MRVLGIDPGFAALGVGLIDSAAGRVSVVHHETVRTQPGPSDEARLDIVGARLWAIARQFLPDAIGYENQASVETGARMGRGRLGSNAKSRRVHEIVGLLRGLALGRSVPLFCLAPQSAKLALLGRGSGRATKKQVKIGVERLFGVARCSQHAADALALAFLTLARARKAAR